MIDVLFNEGDNLHTAINVARNCGLVPHNDKIIIVETFPPSYENESGQATARHVPARIEWKLVEDPQDIDTCDNDRGNIQDRVSNKYFIIEFLSALHLSLRYKYKNLQ